MSRNYEIHYEIRGYDESKEEEIVNILRDKAEANESVFDVNGKRIISADSEINLGGGMSEDEFIHDITKAIWLANGKFCEVNVKHVCLDYLPYEQISKDEEDFLQLINDDKGFQDEIFKKIDPKLKEEIKKELEEF